MDPLAVLAYGAEQAPPLTGLEWKWKQQYSENGNWVDNVIIWYSSRSTVSFSVTSVTSHMKSLMSQDSEIHHLHFMASDIPLQAFSDFTKVSRSPIIRSIRLLAAHATVVSRHLYITSWAHCAVCAVFYFYSPPQICSECNYVTFKTEIENRFWPFPKPKNRFYRRKPFQSSQSTSRVWY